MEEADEFLEPVDPMTQEDDYQTLEQIKTVLHPPHSASHFSYNRVPWNLKIRKEVFSPSETVSSPLAVHLIFCQVLPWIAELLITLLIAPPSITSRL